MAFKKWFSRTLRRALAKRGLRLEYITNDFDSRPLDDHTLARLFASLGEVFEAWNRSQKFFDPVDSFDASQATENFFQQWIGTPFKSQQGGSRFNNLLWLHLIAKAYRPTLVVDSGTFEGASAWALASGAPSSTVLSFDISLQNLRRRATNVRYMEHDWKEFDLSNFDRSRMLCYFDDHVDQVRRLIEASDRGCELAIFDDDYPLTSFYAMAPNPDVLPKIEFALDPELHENQKIEWLTRTGPQSYIVHIKYFEKARAKIAKTGRLPNTSLITGIHQTPYRLIAIAKPLV